MIFATFKKDKRGIFAAEVSGHAGYADHGEDIVCASVSSAVMLTCNGIIEILQEKSTTSVTKDEVHLTLPPCANNAAISFLDALRLHLELLSAQYPNHIKITVLEEYTK